MEEKSILLKYIGDTPKTRILDFFLTGSIFDYSLTDIATKAGVSWKTLYKIFPEFIEHGIIKYTRTLGKSKLYALNKDNPIVKKFMELDEFLIVQERQKIINNLKEKSIAANPNTLKAIDSCL